MNTHYRSTLLATLLCVACEKDSNDDNRDSPGTILAKTSFEGSFETFSMYDPTSIPPLSYFDPTAPDGKMVASISHEPGVKDGHLVAGIFFNFPVDDQPTELWGRFYFKTSSNYVWHPIGNKMIYMRMGFKTNAENRKSTIYWALTIFTGTITSKYLPQTSDGQRK